MLSGTRNKAVTCPVISYIGRDSLPNNIDIYDLCDQLHVDGNVIITGNDLPRSLRGIKLTDSGRKIANDSQHIKGGIDVFRARGGGGMNKDKVDVYHLMNYYANNLMRIIERNNVFNIDVMSVHVHRMQYGLDKFQELYDSVIENQVIDAKFFFTQYDGNDGGDADTTKINTYIRSVVAACLY